MFELRREGPKETIDGFLSSANHEGGASRKNTSSTWLNRPSTIGGVSQSYFPTPRAQPVCASCQPLIYALQLSSAKMAHVGVCAYLGFQFHTSL